MIKLLITTFIFKFYAQINIFNFIKKKHGQNVLQAARTLERLNKNRVKIQADINFINTCNQEDLTPTFAKFKTAIQSNNRKFKNKVTKLIISTELN